MKASDFHLDDEELDYVFDRPDDHPDKSLTVREFVFGSYPKGIEKPTLILMGGQPGAGKSQAIANVTRGRAGELVPISGDDLRRFHKDFHWLAREHPWLMPNATAQASGGWLSRCIKHARENRYSLLLEGVFRDPSMVTRTINQFADAGYRVEVVGLAVPHRESLLSTLGRFLKPTGDEVPRWTPTTAHDSAYQKIPSTLQAVEETEGTWRLRVTNRLAEDLYISALNPAGEQNTSSTGSAAIAAEKERDAPPSPEDARSWLEQYIKHSRELADRGQVNPKTQLTLERLADHARAAGHIAFPDSPAVRQTIDNHVERLHAVPRNTRTELPDVSLPAVDFKTVADHLRQSAEKSLIEAREAKTWLDSYSMCARKLIERGELTKHTAPTMLSLHAQAEQIAQVAFGGQDDRLAQHSAHQVVHKWVFRAGNRGVSNTLLPSSPAQFIDADAEQKKRYKEAMRSTSGSSAAVSKELTEKARQGTQSPGQQSDEEKTQPEDPPNESPKEDTGPER